MTMQLDQNVQPAVRNLLLTSGVFLLLYRLHPLLALIPAAAGAFIAFALAWHIYANRRYNE